MPEIKHQFTGGKMNKDLDERLVPNGQYRDAMNIQVSTSEGSGVGTIQNILGNELGCTTFNNTTATNGMANSYIPVGSRAVGSIADEKNDSLYWLVSGPEGDGNFALESGETTSFKDMIVRLNVSDQTCQPVFVDKHKYCIGMDDLSGIGNSVLLSDSNANTQITQGMTATGYADGLSTFGPTPIIGIGGINMLPVSYVSGLDFETVGVNPMDIVLGDADGTAMFIRGFWNGTDYTNIHFNQNDYDIPGKPNVQTDLPPDGASQFWIPKSALSLYHGITPGTTIKMHPLAPNPGVHPKQYSGWNENKNVLNGSTEITVYDIVLSAVIDMVGVPIPAYIITVGVLGGMYDAGMNKVHICWSDSFGNKYGGNWYTGIWQKVGVMLLGAQDAEANPFQELHATIDPVVYSTTTTTPNNTIIIPPASSAWLDEIYNALYDVNGDLIPGVRLEIQNEIGAGNNFPDNSCIDPATVSAPDDGLYDSYFDIVTCDSLDSGFPFPAGPITQNHSSTLPLTFKIISTGSEYSSIDSIILSEDVDFDGVNTICFESDRVLNFDHDKLITGIDIIDDMLLWTDNFTEPKKINITRSVQGTNQYGEIHTAIINEDLGFGAETNYQPIREEHVTVIKKTPKNALHLELSDGRDSSLEYAGITRVGLSSEYSAINNFSNPATELDFSSINVGDVVSFYVFEGYSGSTELNFAWEEGGYLLLSELVTDSPPGLPLVNWTIRGLITNSQDNNFSNANGDLVLVEIEVVGLNGVPATPSDDDDTNPLFYVVDYEDTEPIIFEDKFPRFSYRYKYEDGEYSTYAPWSEVAFLPKTFDYDPKKGWNTGMLNNIKSIKVKNFRTDFIFGSPVGKDVIAVDILYKEDSSPSVYLVETISPIDILSVENTQLPWYANEYLIKSEAIKGILPSNQLLRSWDNVPKKALAQSISGNRIIYANYEQNYNLKIEGSNYKPDFKNSLISHVNINPGGPLKSLKSLRDYKLGVVFTDKYGRETPVLISENGGFRVKKSDSASQNKLRVGLRGTAPQDMLYYKFFVKETSSEYYNLAMDRWYKAEDGNLWLAFPSSDRNKIDLDTYLYFKKGANGDKNVIENSTKYKVLAIENEAPEFIKTRNIRIGTIEHFNLSDAQVFGDSSGLLLDAPRVERISFTMDYKGGGFFGTSLSKMEDIKEDIYIQFNSSTDSSRQYKVSEITSNMDETESPTSSNPSKYFITLDTALKNDIDFIFDIANDPTRINDGTRVIFTKAVIENKPKFDGRFFAKIENDGKIQTQITEDSFGVNYVETTSKMVYMLEDDDKLKKVSSAALVGSQDSAFNNYVTHDWSGQIDYLDLNPGGNNYNHLCARETYFGPAANASIGVLTGLGMPFIHSSDVKMKNITSPLAIDQLINLNDFDESIGGVWFIDRSTKKWEIQTADDNLFWRDHGDFDHSQPNEEMKSIASANLQQSDPYLADADDRVGTGIVSYTGSNVSVVKLGFGGFKSVNRPGGAVWHDYPITVPLHYHYPDPKYAAVGFFLLGEDSDKQNDVSTDKFVKGLGAGSTFRWKEDPTETLYTISGQTSYEKNIRFGPGDCGMSHTSIPGVIYPPYLVKSTSSYTKTFKFSVTPAMTIWDPAKGPGAYLANGLYLGKGIVGIVITGADISIGDTTITVTPLMDIKKVKIGMSVGTNDCFSNITKVVDVNVLTNTIVVDIAAVSALNAGNVIAFGFMIRITEAHVYNPGFAGNFDLPQENYVIVDGIRSRCGNGNILKSDYNLHKGMQLLAYNVDSDEISDNGMGGGIGIAIKNIENWSPAAVTGAARYKLTLAGFIKPMNDNSFGHELTVDFVLNDRCIFVQKPMNGASNFTEGNTHTCQSNLPKNEYGHVLGDICAIGYTMQFLDGVDEYSDGGNLPESPFVWETEPKEDSGLDIYYEISESNPTQLNSQTISTAIPVGSKVENSIKKGGAWDDVTVVYNGSPSGTEIEISEYIWIGPGNADDGTKPLGAGDFLYITKPNGVRFGVEISEVIPNLITNTISRNILIDPVLLHANYELNWHNCYSFGNGVESNRIKDVFNSTFMTNGVKASTTLGEDYKQERRKNGLIYSGIYNSTSGVNNLNQFIAAEKITKDVNPIYGSIQKLYSRSTADGDLIALCEDRVLKILAEKDALFNADGNPQLTATDRVLGQAMPFSGNYGISKNPESFASESYRVYFTDKVRGTVMRLSKDGLTAISDHGMRDWFRDNLKLNSVLTGSFDDKKDEYNITLKQVVDSSSFPEGVTASFREDVKGWVSFKSFTPENAVSCANEYYTFKNANPWLHHVEQFDAFGKEVGRNTFYTTPKDSSFNVILNDMPGSVKSFNTINYEGSQSKVDQFLIDAGTGLSDGEYYNLHDKKGWYVDSIFTNKESGVVDEFIEKEGKWFNYIKGKNIQLAGQMILVDSNGNSTYDQDSFAIQGLGSILEMPEPTVVAACTDPTAFNYDENAEVDDGSCIAVVNGCTNPAASNYNSSANVDNGSCVWYGCTDPTALNYDPNATYDDGTCIATAYGCTDMTANNYDATANVDDSSCTYDVLGCTDPSQFNYSAGATTDDGSCIPFIYGCTDPLFLEYYTSPLANTDDGSCVNPVIYGCTDAAATNYDASATTDDGTCIYPSAGCTDPAASNYNPGANVDDGSCIYSILGCTDEIACNYDAAAEVDDASCFYCGDPDAIEWGGEDSDCTGGCEYCYGISAASISVNYLNATSLELNWNVPTFDPLDNMAETLSYNITLINYADPSTNVYTIANATNTADWGTANLTFTITGLIPEATYQVVIQMNCVATSGALGSSDSALASATMPPLPLILGCVDELAYNHDPAAEEDDGSCCRHNPACGGYNSAGCLVSPGSDFNSGGGMTTIFSPFNSCISPGDNIEIFWAHGNTCETVWVSLIDITTNTLHESIVEGHPNVNAINGAGMLPGGSQLLTDTMPDTTSVPSTMTLNYTVPNTLVPGHSYAIYIASDGGPGGDGAYPNGSFATMSTDANLNTVCGSIGGCMDVAACNYDATANYDDFTCFFGSNNTGTYSCDTSTGSCYEPSSCDPPGSYGSLAACNSNCFTL